MRNANDDGSTVYAGDILGALDACGLCEDGLAAPGSRWCVPCERMMLAAAIDRAARDSNGRWRRGWDGEPLLYRRARREAAARKFWRIFVWCAAAVGALAALWMAWIGSGR